MSTDGHKVNIKFVDIKWHLADRLSSICVEEDFLLSADLADFFDGLDDSNFIVDHNDRDHDGVWTESLLELLQVYDTIGLNRQVSHIEALLLQVTATVQDTFMVNLSSDDVFLLSVLLVELRNTLDR
jgi:hypothetical protein